MSEQNTSQPPRTKVAIIGSGNIGTDLMIKVLQQSQYLEMGAMVGIDPDSDGLARAAAKGVPTTNEGVEGLTRMAGFDDIEIVFDATSAKAHIANDALLRPLGKRMIDLTPAAIGPFVVPGRSPCVRCLDLSRSELDREWPLLLAQLARHRPDDDEVAMAWALGTAAAQVVGWLHHGRVPPLGVTIELPWEGLAPEARSWRRHPRCPCGQPS